MLERLCRLAREAREAAGRTQLDIATAAGTSHAAVSRFEMGAMPGIGLEEMAAAYERECGLEEGELWRRAIDEQGNPRK